MILAEFKSIFWWEWSHRLLGRLAGVAFALPFIIFLALRQLPARLIWRCAILLVLGALQGLVGWWMVQERAGEPRLGRAGAIGDPPGAGADPVLRADLDGDGGLERAGARPARRAPAPGAFAAFLFLGLVFFQACSARWWPATRPG